MSDDERRPAFWQLQLMGWGVLFLVMVSARTDHRPFLPMAGWRLVYIGQGALLSLALRAVLQRMLARARGMTATAITCVAVSYLLALAWTATFNLLRQPMATVFAKSASATDLLNTLFLGAINDSVILIAWGFLYLGLEHAIALQRERERALQAEALMSTSRLHALRYQLNPHLLFNTLNAISTLIVEQRAKDATAMIARLSDLLRTMLRPDAAALVPLVEELALAGQYLDIEQVRFGDRLTVTYDVEEEAYRAEVPVLLLQPLVENAVHHGIAKGEGPVVIALTARVAAGMLMVIVENSGAATPAHGREGGGIGLANVRDRLALHYGTRQAMRTEAPPAGGFRVEIELPYVMPDPRPAA